MFPDNAADHYPDQWHLCSRLPGTSALHTLREINLSFIQWVQDGGLQSSSIPCANYSGSNLVTLISGFCFSVPNPNATIQAVKWSRSIMFELSFWRQLEDGAPYGNNLYFPLAAYVACLMKCISYIYFKYLIELQQWQLSWLLKNVIHFKHIGMPNSVTEMLK
jgi:hypothetical protein